MSKTAIVKTKPKTTAVTKFQAPEGYKSNIDQDDVAVPLILLVQPTSDMDEWKTMKKEDVPRAGMFYNPTSNATYESLKGIVIRQFVQVYTLKLKEGDATRTEFDKFSSDGIHWNHNGAVIQKSEFRWNEDGSKLGVALKRFNYVVLLEGEDMPVIVRFKSTSASNAKKLNYNLIKLIPNWINYFEFTTVKTTNDKGTFYKINSQLTQDQPTQEAFDLGTVIWESYENTTIKVAGEDDVKETEDKDDDLPF